MPEFIVKLDAPNGMETKRVTVYLENLGEYRQISRNDVPQSIDIDTYVTNNFSALWNAAQPLARDIWDSAYEGKLRNEYRSIVRAGIVEARDPAATLVSVTLAMETALLATDKAAAYTRLKTLATGSTSVNRDAFFNLVVFLALNDLLAD